MTNRGPVPAIGYVRVSTEREEMISDEIQKAIIEDAARRANRTIVKWIVDLNATGRNFKRQIMDAIAHVEAGDLDGAKEVWVWKFSRFGRSQHGIAVNLARIEQAGGRLISATEDVDASTATGGFTRDMLFAIAQFESNRIGEQWRETHDLRRKNGMPAQGGHRFGYLWTPRIDESGHPQEERYDVNHETADALVDVYRRYANGTEGFLALAKSLNEQGLKNPHSLTRGGWSMQSLAQYMDSGFPAGLLHVHVAENCGKRSACPKPREHYGYIEGAHKAVIDQDLWQAYLTRRSKRQAAPPRSRIPLYPFTGHVHCGRCGGTAGAYSVDGQRGGGWRCSRNLNGSGACEGATVTTRRLLREVTAWLARIEAEIDRSNRGLRVEPTVDRPDTSKQRQRVVTRLAQLQEALDRAATAHALGDIPRDSYLRVRDQLQAEEQQKKKELQAFLDAEEVQPAELATHLLVVRQLRSEWPMLPVVAINDLLGVVLKEIRIWPKAFEPRVVLVPTDALMVFQS
jgi:site-specific DNA recombinase